MTAYKKLKLILFVRSNTFNIICTKLSFKMDSKSQTISEPKNNKETRLQTNQQKVSELENNINYVETVWADLQQEELEDMEIDVWHTPDEDTSEEVNVWD